MIYAVPPKNNVNVWARNLKAFKKRNAAPVKLAGRRILVVHQTACRFGTVAYQRAAWVSAAKAAGAADVHAYTTYWARRARFWNIPYHYLITLDGEVLWNQPLEWKTWHGNAGNGGLGVAFEGRWPALESDRDPKRHTTLPKNAASLVWSCILHARSQGAPISQVQAHRNYAPPHEREADPGEDIWRNAVVPLLRDPKLGLRCDYEGAAGGGRPIPREWDDHALYDWHGKRIEGGAA